MKKNKIIIAIIILLLIIIAFFIFSYNKETGELIEINYKEVKEKVNNKDSFILVITQSTCSHCVTYKPKLKEIAKKHNLDIYFISLDLENKENKKSFLKEFKFSGATPTTIFIKNGIEDSILNRLEGDVSIEKAITKFKKMGFIEE